MASPGLHAKEEHKRLLPPLHLATPPGKRSKDFELIVFDDQVSEFNALTNHVWSFAVWASRF